MSAKVARIDALTDEQRARFPEWVEKWTRIGLSTAPADRPRAEAAIRTYYRAAGLPEPQRIAWTTSPLAGAYAFPAAALILAAEARHRVSGDSVRASVGDSVRASVGASVDASVDASVGASVRASVDASVDASVRDSVDASVDPTVHAAYRRVLSDTFYRYMGGQFWVGYGWYSYWSSPSMLSYFRDVCGLDFGDKTEIVDAIIALGESCCWWWPHREFALVSDRPSVVARDEAGRLHSTTGPACGFRDGWGVYAVHGTRVPAWIIEHPERVTVAAIHAEKNEEIRRIMVERYGLAKYVRDAQFQVLDEDKDPLGQPRRLLRRDDLVVVELTNSTLDADGTRRVYHVACEPSLRPLLPDGKLGDPQKLTALNAVASTYGMRGEEYVLGCET